MILSVVKDVREGVGVEATELETVALQLWKYSQSPA